jgi:hypothetical protein
MPGNTPTTIPKTLPTKIAEKTGTENTLFNEARISTIV